MPANPQISQSIAKLLSEIGDDDPTQGSFTEARQKAREGDWEPLFRLQWPTAVIDDFQREFLGAVFDKSTWGIFCKGSTASGKGAVTAQAICLWYDVWRDARIIVTSVTLNHAQTTLFAEVKRWWNRMTILPKGFVGSQKVDHNEEHFILVVNPNDPNNEGFSGKHGLHTLFVFDEASSTDPAKFVMAENQAKKLIAISNPRTNLCHFKKVFPTDDPDTTQSYMGPYGKIFCQTIDALSLLNYRTKRLSKPLGPIGGIEIRDKWFNKGDEIPEEYYKDVAPIIPGQRCYDEIQGDLDPTSPSYSPHKVQWQVHAKFPLESEDTQVILPSWLTAPAHLWKSEVDHEDTGLRIPYRSTIPVTCFGIDIAASTDGDVSVLAAGGSRGCAGLTTWRSNDVMESVGKCLSLARELYGVDLTTTGIVAYDSVGIGSGVGTRLQELGVEVVPTPGNARPTMEPEVYYNLRAQLYGQLGQRLRPDGPWGYNPKEEDDTENIWAIPDDMALHEELCVAEKLYQSTGKFKLTPKSPIRGTGSVASKGDTIREKLGRSPDRADAVVYLYHAVRIFEGDATPEINRPLLMLSEEEAAAIAQGEYHYDPDAPVFSWKTSWELQREMGLPEDEYSDYDNISRPF